MVLHHIEPKSQELYTMKNNLLNIIKFSYTPNDSLKSEHISTGDVVKIRLGNRKSDKSSFKGICISKKNKGNNHFNFLIRSVVSGDTVDILLSSEHTKPNQIEKDNRASKLLQRYISKRSKYYNIKKSIVRRIVK